MALSPGSKKSLGARHYCTKCKTAFYDFGKSIPRCPICDVIPFKLPKQKFQKNEALTTQRRLSFRKNTTNDMAVVMAGATKQFN